MSDLWDFTGKSEVYGLKKIDSDGDVVNVSLQVTTTNGGASSITSAQLSAFDDYFFAAIGFTFSIDSNGHLIATIDN